jgi:aminopeptidase N
MFVRAAVAVAALVGTGLSGLSSGGDPYFPLDGNRGYDVQHYRISNTYDPDTDRLVGRTTLRATATEPLTELSLDLVLPVDEVLVDGRKAEFTKPRRHELHLDPVGTLGTGDTFTVVVRYHGRPGQLDAAGASPGRDLYFHRTGETVAMGEPQNGAWWFAANETPRDKATFDIAIRVPRGVEAVSNGALVSRAKGSRWTRWHWRLSEPVATYHAFFAAGQYVLDKRTEGDLDVVHAVPRALTDAEERTALRRLRQTTEVVGWLESSLGDYPYDQTGGLITALSSSYALETATRPVYPWTGTLGSRWTALLVHEQAHQWFGNHLTLRRWRDIWLNEGFATYAEWWYAEEEGGRSVAERLAATYASIGAGQPFWEVRVSDPGPARMWDEAVYVRGAMTLAALRARIGEPGFGALLREWVTRNHAGHVTGESFRALAEEVSGEELDEFFQHWLDDPAKPAKTAENGLG